MCHRTIIHVEGLSHDGWGLVGGTMGLAADVHAVACIPGVAQDCMHTFMYIMHSHHYNAAATPRLSRQKMNKYNITATNASTPMSALPVAPNPDILHNACMYKTCTCVTCKYNVSVCVTVVTWRASYLQLGGAPIATAAPHACAAHATHRHTEHAPHSPQVPLLHHLLGLTSL